MHVSNSTLL